MAGLLTDLDSEAHKIIAQYERKSAAVLPLLHLAQEKTGYITPEVEAWVSRWSEAPVVHVREVVTFYSMFHKKAPGRHHIRFCTSTSCMLRGAGELLERLEKKLKIRRGETTPDGKFSLEEAECLCACEVAPMMQVDGPYFGPLDERKMDRIIERLTKDEKPETSNL